MGAGARRFNELSIANPYSIDRLFELDGRGPPNFSKLWRVIPPRPPLKIEKLSDNFGQFVITLQCECGHSRNASPKTFAGIAGWDAKLADVVKRARCSKCGRRGRCTVSVRHEHKRDG